MSCKSRYGYWIVIGLLSTLIGCEPDSYNTASYTDIARLDDGNPVVDMADYLENHDMIYELLPERHQDGFLMGNGVMGVQVYRQAPNRLVFQVSRSDVYSLSTKVFPHRKPIGQFVMQTCGNIDSLPVKPFRVSIYDAKLTGSLKTSEGTVALSAYIQADQEILAVRAEASGNESVSWVFEGDANPQPTRKPDDKEPYFRGPLKNVPPALETVGDVELFHIAYEEAGDPAGKISVGWQDNDGVFSATIAYNRNTGVDTRDTALATLSKFSVAGFGRALQEHRTIWQEYMGRRFVSIPDKKLESFYYIQLYKMRSAARVGGTQIDLQGTWFDPSTPWPGTWHNLNSQLTYWVLNAGNALELTEPLIRTMDEQRERFQIMAGRFDDAYALHGNTTMDFIAPGPGDSFVELHENLPDYESQGLRNSYVFHRATFGNFLWLTHNLWLIYRHSMDEVLLQDVIYPFLQKGLNLYFHILEKDEAGTWHLPRTYSPEYAYAEDASYDLSILRWGCNALLQASDVLGTDDDAHAMRCRDILGNLTPFPFDNEQGFLIGRDTPLADAHRHYSHLMMIFPFYEITDPEIVRQSVEHWQHFSSSLREPHEALVGYSYTGASSMYAAIGDGEKAYDYLDAFIDSHAFGRVMRANTMYYETESATTGTTFEVPITAASNVHEMLLQSWGDRIRVFPAVPASWTDASFHGFRAEGAFLIGADRRDGRLVRLQVRSLAGEACRIEAPGIAGLGILVGEAKITYLSDDLIEIDLDRGEEIILTLDGDGIEVTPVAAGSEPVNYYGLKH